MDKGLGVRFASGRPDSVRDVYREYGRPVFSVALRMLGDRSLAEEAVQQTFLQAWRASATFDPARDLGPWLFTIARRVAIDIHRRERRHRADALGEHDVAVLPPSMDTAWVTWEVRRALESLTPDERNVVKATHFDGLTHEEAAAVLGIPVGTVKSRSHRAYRRLAGLLSHLEEASA